MASSDLRHHGARKTNTRKAFSQLSWGATGHAADTATLSNINMLVERVDVIASNAANGITFTVNIYDENSVASNELFSKSSIPENAQTVYLSTKATPDFPAFPVADNTLTVSVDPSGDAGAGGVTVDVVIYGP